MPPQPGKFPFSVTDFLYHHHTGLGRWQTFTQYGYSFARGPFISTRINDNALVGL